MRAILLLLLLLLYLADGYDYDDPKSPHTKWAMELYDVGRKEDALEAFRSEVRFKPSSETFINLGVCLMRMRRYHQVSESN